jgi:hypothetical protein
MTNSNLNFLIFKKKRFELINKKKLYFNLIQEFLPIYYPFKLGLKELELIFDMY